MVLGYLGATTTGIPNGMAVTPDGSHPGALWATMAFWVSFNGTYGKPGMLMQIHPTLRAVYECDARAAGLVWADYELLWMSAQSLLTDTNNAAFLAFEAIRVAATDSPKIKDAGATYSPNAYLNGFMTPLPANNDMDAYCNIVFAALEEENMKALSFIVNYATYDPSMPSGNALLAHCNEKMEELVMKAVIPLVAGVGAGCLVAGLAMACIGCWCYNKNNANKNEGI